MSTNELVTPPWHVPIGNNVLALHKLIPQLEELLLPPGNVLEFVQHLRAHLAKPLVVRLPVRILVPLVPRQHGEAGASVEVLADGNVAADAR
eukprot:CAMPEP_0196189982 /NCGR_PEP_ID=MMETSP0911-20130528/45400_1 /TAXON_ID=49265 /ORGANISM="Thalassiosira rotula, Strain GSO102" /LENGTH=91 /DNA_ID=CAMNT_0041461703 /DNA_START=10 /DNA_END=285 /DNA_ORIENTATION=-